MWKGLYRLWWHSERRKLWASSLDLDLFVVCVSVAFLSLHWSCGWTAGTYRSMLKLHRANSMIQIPACMVTRRKSTNLQTKCWVVCVCVLSQRNRRSTRSNWQAGRLIGHWRHVFGWINIFALDRFPKRPIPKQPSRIWFLVGQNVKQEASFKANPCAVACHG